MPVRSTELVAFECVDRFSPSRVYRRPEESAAPGNVRYGPTGAKNILNLPAANRNRTFVTVSERPARVGWPAWKEVSGMTNAGDLMPQGDASAGKGQHRPEHQFWLTMQAAHAPWAHATETLDYLIGPASSHHTPYPHE